MVERERREDRGGVEARRLSRRRLLQGAGALVLTAGVAASCEAPPFRSESGAARPLRPQPAPALTPRRVRVVEGQYPRVPDTPRSPPDPGVLRFFSLHEALTVEAYSARLMPGTPEDPGAREAGVVTYIDNMLAYDDPFAQSTYRSPPFAETYAGDSPPAAAPGGFEVVWVHEDEVERYGYQSVLGPRETYRTGLQSVDRYARELFGADFVDLTEAQQDRVVGDMADGVATGFDHPGAEEFFHVLRRHTCEGMFSDPVYGGNRDLVGWRLIGYPGAQRAYTEADVRGLTEERAAQGILDLHRFHAGEAVNEHVLLPVSGARHRHGDE